MCLHTQNWIPRHLQLINFINIVFLARWLNSSQVLLKYLDDYHKMHITPNYILNYLYHLNADFHYVSVLFVLY